MRRAAFLLAVLAAAPAFAQETQQDLAERIVREQEEIRRKQVEKVASAPARAWDRAERDPCTHVSTLPEPAPAAAPPPAAAAPPRPGPPGGGFPFVLVACLLPVIPLAVLAWATWRRMRLEGR